MDYELKTPRLVLLRRPPTKLRSSAASHSVEPYMADPSIYGVSCKFNLSQARHSPQRRCFFLLRITKKRIILNYWEIRYAEYSLLAYWLCIIFKPGWADSCSQVLVGQEATVQMADNVVHHTHRVLENADRRLVQEGARSARRLYLVSRISYNSKSRRLALNYRSW